MIILGKELPEIKKAYIGLAEIKGIGYTKAKFICKLYNVSPNCLIRQLTKEQQSKIENYIEKNITVEDELKKTVSQNIINYIENGCLRGYKHRNGLPVRGQRTHSNGQTQKKRKFNYININRKLI